MAEKAVKGVLNSRTGEDGAVEYKVVRLFPAPLVQPRLASFSAADASLFSVRLPPAMGGHGQERGRVGGGGRRRRRARRQL